MIVINTCNVTCLATLIGAVQLFKWAINWSLAACCHVQSQPHFTGVDPTNEEGRYLCATESLVCGMSASISLSHRLLLWRAVDTVSPMLCRAYMYRSDVEVVYTPMQSFMSTPANTTSCQKGNSSSLS